MDIKITAVFGRDNISVILTGEKNEHGWLRVQAKKGEPFNQFTHGGWVPDNMAWAPPAMLKDIRVNDVPIEVWKLRQEAAAEVPYAG